MDRKSYWNIEKAEEERLAGNENFKKGNYPDAIKHYNEGLKRVPDDDKVKIVLILHNLTLIVRKPWLNFIQIVLELI